MYRPQLRQLPDSLNFAQRGEIVAFVRDDVMQHLAQAGRHRAECRFRNAWRQCNRAAPFVDELPGEVDVGAILKSHHDLRQSELGNRANLLQPRQAADFLLDGIGNLLLHLRRVEGRRRGIDLHLHRRRVRKGIDVQMSEGQYPQRSERQDAQNHPEPMPQRNVDDPIQHDSHESRERRAESTEPTAFPGLSHGSNFALKPLSIRPISSASL